ncbi:MAG: serine hydrolase [Gemmatimonadetes bacterium]|nr:serine hydrolase [Gemmatimonadota bacterium]
MTETGYTRPNWSADRIAHGYQDGRDWGTIVEKLRVPGAPFWALRGNGGLQTTLADMARWEKVARTNVVLTDSSRRKWMTGYVNEGPMGMSKYAYGWAVHMSPRNTRVVEHNGGNGVYVAEWRRLVDEGITILVTSSVSNLTASAVVDNVESLVFGGEVRLPPAVATVDAKALAAFAGSWKSPTGDGVDVERDGNRLLLRATGPLTWRLMTQGDTATTPRATELGARALSIVQAMTRGEAQPLHDALAEPEPLDEMTQQVRNLAADRVQRLGALKAVTLLGAIARQQGMLVTTVRLDYERGVVSNVFQWGPGGRILRRVARPLAAAMLVPTSATAFERVDLSGGPPDPAVKLERVDATHVALVAPNGTRVVLAKAS